MYQIVFDADGSRTILKREIPSTGSLDDILEIASGLLGKFAFASTGLTVLHRVVLHDDILAVKLLVDAKMDVNCTTSKGITTLQIASLVGNAEVVRSLLEAGARPSEIAGAGITALHLAVCLGHREVVELFGEGSGCTRWRSSYWPGFGERTKLYCYSTAHRLCAGGWRHRQNLALCTCDCQHRRNGRWGSDAPLLCRRERTCRYSKRFASSWGGCQQGGPGWVDSTPRRNFQQ
jgi:ankyrin repeat protein